MYTDILAMLNTIFSFITGVATCSISVILYRRNERSKRRIYLNKVTFEFVTDFIMPFYDLKKEIQPIWENHKQQHNVSEVQDILQNYVLRTTFSSWDIYKSEIWVALEDKNEGNTEFELIRDFVSAARMYAKEMDVLLGNIKEFLDERNIFDIEIEEYSKEKYDNYHYVLESGVEKINKLEKIINNLPNKTEREKIMKSFEKTKGKSYETDLL